MLCPSQNKCLMILVLFVAEKVDVFWPLVVRFVMC